MRTRDELRDATHAHGYAKTNWHAENLFCKLAHTFHQHAATREHSSGSELVQDARVFKTLANDRENLFDPWLDDVRKHATRNLPRHVSTNSGHFDFFVVRYHSSKRTTEVAFQSLGLRHRSAQTGCQIRGDIVATCGDDTDVSDAAISVHQQICGSTTHVDHDDANFLLVFRKHSFGTR